MIGLLIAVMAAAALAAPSLAMAETTALCAVDENPCSEANRVTEVHFKAHNISILSPLEGKYDYGCDALFTATASKLGAPQTLEAQSLVFTSCGGGCTRITEELGTFSVLRTESEKATITSSGFKIKVNCSAFKNCVYSFEGGVGTVKGALVAGTENGDITYSQVSLPLVSGVFCPKEARLDALFEASAPFYVSS